MDASKRFVLIVGSDTDKVTAGACQFCASYNSWKKVCTKGKTVYYRSYIKYECDKAVEAGIKIIVLYKEISVNKSKCPEAVRYLGVHAPMWCKKDGEYYWDYSSVKKAFDDSDRS